VHFAAIDVGASSGRVMLARLLDDRLEMSEVHRFPNGPVERDGSLRWDAPELFTQIRAGLAACAQRAPDLAGVGVDTWGVDYALLDEKRALVTLPYHYRDARTSGVMEQVFERIPRPQIYARTGTQFLPFNTLYQLFAHRRHRPRDLDRAQRLLMMPDLFHLWLTGRESGEATIASTTQFFDSTGDGGAGTWNADHLETLGIRGAILPELVRPGTLLGPLCGAAARELGLPRANVYAPGSHDTASALAGVPATGDDWAFISCGTWAPVGVELPAPIRSDAALAANFTNEFGVAGRSRFLTNVPGLWLLQECLRAWRNAGREFAFDEIASLARAAPPLAAAVDPEDPAFAEPTDMPEALSVACQRTGQPVPGGVGAFVRMILESVAAIFRRPLSALEQITGRAIRKLHVVGGGARNPLLCQWIADATGRPVLAGPVEAAAMGNVLTQALAAGYLASLEQIREVVAHSEEVRRHDPASERERWDDFDARLSAIRAANVG